jgi:8-oxo-dGTP pyrophosphatase MutT (NUDIX family)
MKIASGVAVFYKDLVLLAKRIELWEGQPIALGGYWGIFAGSVEYEETPITCAARELFEETEIKADTDSLQHIGVIDSEDLSFHMYALELSEKIEPTLNEEHTEYGWFLIDQLDNFQDKIEPEMAETLISYKKYREKL